ADGDHTTNSPGQALPAGTSAPREGEPLPATEGLSDTAVSDRPGAAHERLAAGEHASRDADHAGDAEHTRDADAPRDSRRAAHSPEAATHSPEAAADTTTGTAS